MRRPSARVGRNRRCAYLYSPVGVLGALVVFTAPAANGGHLAGALMVLAAAVGFVLEADPAAYRARSSR